MSFVKRNTANLAGGVNPASTPNVSQYGWTKYEAQSVNQIIEYVNVCKTYSEQTKQDAAFVAEAKKLVENVTNLANTVKALTEEVRTLSLQTTQNANAAAQSAININAMTQINNKTYNDFQLESEGMRDNIADLLARVTALENKREIL